MRFTKVGFVELCCLRLWPGHVAFQIQDSGPGIPAEVSKRLSTGFMRADGTVWHRYHGAQLGLSISKRLVELMGGRLVFHSEPWQGTTVRVELPVGGKGSFFATRQSPLAADRESPTRRFARSQPRRALTSLNLGQAYGRNSKACDPNAPQRR